jgi:hypothetical protein
VILDEFDVILILTNIENQQHLLLVIVHELGLIELVRHIPQIEQDIYVLEQKIYHEMDIHIVV